MNYRISTKRTGLIRPYRLIDRRRLQRLLAAGVLLLSLMLALPVGNFQGSDRFAVQSALALPEDWIPEAITGACFAAGAEAATDCAVAVVFGGEDPTGQLIASCLNSTGKYAEACGISTSGGGKSSPPTPRGPDGMHPACNSSQHCN